MILEALDLFPDGLIDEEIEHLISRQHSAVSGNRRHLVQRGFVMDSGRKGRTSNGKVAIKWVLDRRPRAPE